MKQQQKLNIHERVCVCVCVCSLCEPLKKERKIEVLISKFLNLTAEFHFLNRTKQHQENHHFYYEFK
jgi:hypothetical protein